MSAIVQQSLIQDADSRWAAFRSHVGVTREKFERGAPSTCLYALVDTRGLPDLRSALERLDSILFASLWDGSDLSAFEDIAPLVIKIDLGAAGTDVPQQLLKRLWRFADEGFMVTWIWSPFALHELANHFRAYCEYTLPDRRTFYLHFYDNRILERLRLTWTAEEWARFAGVAFEMGYRNGAGVECIWSADTPRLSEETTAPALTLEQHLALLALGIPDKLAMQLREICGSFIDHLSPQALREAVRIQVERAARYRIQYEGDLLLYATKGLLISPRFDENPQIQPQLELASYGDVSFFDVLSQIDDAFRENFGLHQGA
ncbi:DUF4123 domain-containing protein [Paraburkholderia fungorum]|uniref:DUF4123 domain-containing protein n=1 Tax=Paraburkholderia fungorum TaxID=134537 RepID=UPI0038BA2128